MSDNCRVSEALFVGLCDYVGTPTDVTVRREMHDMVDIINKPVHKYQGRGMIVSGSYREGFRVTPSDIDIMYWFFNHKVITDISQYCIYDPSKHSVILMEDNDTPPGFVRLRLITSPPDENIESSIVAIKEGMYISNIKWRLINFESISGRAGFESVASHGPCAAFIFESLQSDCCLCFHSSFWSEFLSNWKARCALHNWPPRQLFADIHRLGCHVVPIESKLVEDNSELEWRLSFSQAEKKLVSFMNRTQFLCYGCLKIFLVDIVNRNTEEPFLCSYFMKTTLLWLIQVGNITWCPNGLLDCFWKCFKYLLHCIYQGVMPNFFIPQNNMFAGKLANMNSVRARECLLEKLNYFYETGISFMLQSPAFRSIINRFMLNNYFRLLPVKEHFKDMEELDGEVKMELFTLDFFAKDIEICYIYLKSILTFSQYPITENQKLALQKCTVEVLVQTAFINFKRFSKTTNKKLYRSDRLNCKLLTLAGKFGNVSDLLYLALYYFRTLRYKKARTVTNLVKLKLSKPYIMYENVDQETYNKSVEKWSLSKRMGRAWAENICLSSHVQFIRELTLEQEKSRLPHLIISPFVMTHMLSVLCNYKLGNRSQCLQSLTDLQTLLLFDEETNVTLSYGDLSWQILGICQHVVGDLHGALQSYQQSLSQEPYHQIQNATEYRLALVLNQFLSELPFYFPFEYLF